MLPDLLGELAQQDVGGKVGGHPVEIELLAGPGPVDQQGFLTKNQRTMPERCKYASKSDQRFTQQVQHRTR